MKSKKIISSLAAISVLAASSLSFAVTIDGANIQGKLVNNRAGATIEVKRGTVKNIVSNANMTLKADTATAKAVLANTDVEVKAGTANLSGIKVKSVVATVPTDVTGEAEGQVIGEIPAEPEVPVEK